MNRIEFAVTRYYLTNYLAPAITVSYLPVWLDKQGFDQNQIAALNALILLGILLFSTTVGRWADRLADWKSAIVISTWLSTLLTALLFFSDNTLWIFWVWILASLPISLITPVSDAATMRKAKRADFQFGTVRAWGTMGYVVMCFGAGVILDYFGSALFLPLFFSLTLLRAVTALGLPSLRDQVTQSIRRPGFLVSKELLADLPFGVVLPLLAGALLLASHMALAVFGALLWKQQGFSETAIGLLIAVGSLAEALCMFYFKQIEIRFTARTIILIAAIAGALRWTIMVFEPPLWALFILQLSHAISFAIAYLGCLYFINNRVDESFTAEAQSLFTLIQQMMAAVSILLFGYWFGIGGSWALLINTVMCVVAAAMISWSFNLLTPLAPTPEKEEMGK